MCSRCLLFFSPLSLSLRASYFHSSLSFPFLTSSLPILFPFPQLLPISLIIPLSFPISACISPSTSHFLLFSSPQFPSHFSRLPFPHTVLAIGLIRYRQTIWVEIHIFRSNISKLFYTNYKNTLSGLTHPAKWPRTDHCFDQQKIITDVSLPRGKSVSSIRGKKALSRYCISLLCLRDT